MKPTGEPDELNPQARLASLTRRAALTLLWEALWPPLASAGAVVALFLAASWGGLWYALPLYGRLLGLVAFAAGLIYVLRPIAALRRPASTDILARLDRDAETRHRPASAYVDHLANDSGDPETRALWALHRTRLAEQVQKLEVAPPSPRMAWRDPRALRFAAVLLAVAAFLGAGPERYPRLFSGFDFRVGANAALARVDAWIDPPAYANKPPILLSIAGQKAPESVTAAEDSAIVLRAETDEIDAATEGALKPLALKSKPQTGIEKRFAVHGDGVFRILRNRSAIAQFNIHSLATQKPTIALVEPPKANLSGSLTLRYRIAGAYGISGAEGAFEAPGGAKHRLVEPPKFALALPSAPGGQGEATATIDLAESPWAGAEGTLTLSATDAAGKTGSSEPAKQTLPQRAFTKPLARALVEQRRNLVLDPDGQRGKVVKVLAALALAPELFDTPPSVYLGLHAAQSRLDRAHNDKALMEVADLLWSMALQIEDGDASRALRDFRAAEQKLREALKNGASEAEVRELTRQLRDAAKKYLSELARNGDKANPQDTPADAKDLDSMLDRLENSAENGARADAEAMLDELQNMLENMRGAQSNQESAAQREMRRQMSELDKLMRDQQKLRDDTFRHDQRARERSADPNASPDSKSDDNADAQALENRQQALSQKLEELKQRMKALGLKGEQGFDEAQGDMQEAERDLQPQDGQKDGSDGDAVGAQGRALEDMRKGMQGLQQQMQARGSGGGGYQSYVRQPGSGRDPLGRGPQNDRGAMEGALNGGAGPAERARRVLQELRRRLADPNRPGEERDYLERLLKPD